VGGRARAIAAVEAGEAGAAKAGAVQGAAAAPAPAPAEASPVADELYVAGAVVHVRPGADGAPELRHVSPFALAELEATPHVLLDHVPWFLQRDLVVAVGDRFEPYGWAKAASGGGGGGGGGATAAPAAAPAADALADAQGSEVGTGPDARV
jgi:hypothetical protein